MWLYVEAVNIRHGTGSLIFWPGDPVPCLANIRPTRSCSRLSSIFVKDWNCQQAQVSVQFYTLGYRNVDANENYHNIHELIHRSATVQSNRNHSSRTFVNVSTTLDGWRFCELFDVLLQCHIPPSWDKITRSVEGHRTLHYCICVLVMFACKYVCVSQSECDAP